MIFKRVILYQGKEDTDLRKKKQWLAGYGFISLWLIGLFVFTLIPMIYSFYISLTEWDFIGTPRFIGFKNYMDIIIHFFRSYPEMAIFLTLGIGFWIGSLKYKNFSLGTVTSVLLVGVLVGQMNIDISCYSYLLSDIA